MMSCYKRLFIWVEGLDDQRFIENIIIPYFEERYDDIRTIKYANMNNEKFLFL